MPDNSSSTDDSTADQDAAKFAEVASGIYRRFDAEAVSMALQHAVREQLFSQQPTIMLMFVRIAEIYPAAAATLRQQQSDVSGPLRQAIDLILDPPQDIRDAKYLPHSIQSPGEMDLCWAEFLVTGKTEIVHKIVSVLDREDQTREFLNTQLTNEPGGLQLSDTERMELQQFGIGLGKPTDDSHWQVMTEGDTDLFLWLGIKDQNKLCLRVFEAMNDSQKLHIANKGAALWSLQANATQHGAIRLLCNEAAEADGGFGRKLLTPSS